MRQDVQSLIEQVEAEKEAARQECRRRLEEGNLLDEDGYPSESVLWMLEHWPFDDAQGWLDLAQRAWHFRDLTWTEKMAADDFEAGKIVKLLHVSAFGWSGNESLIAAMQANTMLWGECWVQSRRGGHYIFELPSAPKSGSGV